MRWSHVCATCARDLCTCLDVLGNIMYADAPSQKRSILRLATLPGNVIIGPKDDLSAPLPSQTGCGAGQYRPWQRPLGLPAHGWAACGVHRPSRLTVTTARAAAAAVSRQIEGTLPLPDGEEQPLTGHLQTAVRWKLDVVGAPARPPHCLPTHESARAPAY